jgi:hypothetical protein
MASCKPQDAADEGMVGEPGWSPGLSISGGGRSSGIRSGVGPASSVDEWSPTAEQVIPAMVGDVSCQGHFLRVGTPINSAGKTVSSPPPQGRAPRIRARNIKALSRTKPMLRERTPKESVSPCGAGYVGYTVHDGTVLCQIEARMVGDTGNNR